MYCDQNDSYETLLTITNKHYKHYVYCIAKYNNHQLLYYGLLKNLYQMILEIGF